MIYTFSCKATGQLLMAGAVVARLLPVIVQDAGARGIIEVDTISSAVRAIEAAVAEDEARSSEAGSAPSAAFSEVSDVDPVTLGQHAWPLTAMMNRASAASETMVRDA